MPRTNIYVDGFNLYYGALKRTPHKWLDVAAMCRRILPKTAINRIRYFTAIIDGSRDAGAPLRQQIYIRALETTPNLTVHRGFFLTKVVWARSATPPPPTVRIFKTEEKGSDVNLATYLLLDAFRGDYDQAVLISNDSDLCEPIKVVQKEFGLPVGIINPHSRPAAELLKVACFWRSLRPSTVAASQFPQALTDRIGPFSRPPGW
jgi:uncharacterized LabA/DUF88 family protein